VVKWGYQTMVSTEVAAYWSRKEYDMNIEEGERASAHIVGAGEGETYVVGGVTVTMKVTGKETGGVCTIFESLIPPHFAGYEAYGHLRATATYYVTSGMLAFTIAQETLMVRSGGFVMVPPGKLHKFWNPTAQPATCLTYLCPAGFEQYIVALAMLTEQEACWPPADGSKVAALSKQYELKTWP
jgi:mannose-6-phosphate isomerase-like protein (cupin superfamily)